jgi:MFS family permease
MSQQTNSSGSKITAKAPKYAWIILLVLYLASLAATLNLYKVPPLMPLLMSAFNINLVSANMLMSIFSIMGFVLAIPAGFIIRKFGPKATGLIATAAVLIGSTLGAFSTASNMMLVSRFIEGIGMGLVMVLAPSVIALWFPAEVRGAPMGLWSTCVGVGSFAIYNAAPAMVDPNNVQSWRIVWWAGAAFSLAALILFAVLFRLPKSGELAEAPASGKKDDSSEKAPSFKLALTNPSLWFASLAFLAFNATILALSSNYPTFLNEVRGLQLGYANFMASLMMMTATITAPLGGYFSDRTGSRKLIIVIPLILLTITFLFPFKATGQMIPLLMIVMGAVGAPAATNLLAAVPEVLVLPQLAGIGMAVMALGQNIGMFVGPILFSSLVESFGWLTAGYLLIPICLIGIIAGWLIKVR